MKKILLILFIPIFFLIESDPIKSDDINDNMVILDYPILMADSIINNPEIILKILKDTNNLSNYYDNLLSNIKIQNNIVKYIKENKKNHQCQRSIELNTLTKSNLIIYYVITITYRKCFGETILIIFAKDLENYTKDWKLAFIQIGDPPHVPPLEFEKKE